MPGTCIMSALWSCARWNLLWKKVRTLHCLFLSALCWLTIRWSGYLFLRIQSKWSNKSLGVPCSIASFQHQPQQLCICAAVEKITWAKKSKKRMKEMNDSTLWLEYTSTSFYLNSLNKLRRTHTNTPNCLAQTHATALCVFFIFLSYFYCSVWQQEINPDELKTNERSTQDSRSKKTLSLRLISRDYGISRYFLFAYCV